MNDWYKSEAGEWFYHGTNGKILGSVLKWTNKYKAMLGNMFIGFYISEEHAKNAVESAWKDSQNDKSWSEDSESL